jgi:carbon-monoxide dehydrogenase small subunit
VLVDGQPVKSCTMFAVQADGHEVTTSRLAGASELHPCRRGSAGARAPVRFCTPGMMLAAKALSTRTRPHRGRDPWHVGQPVRCTVPEHRQVRAVGRRQDARSAGCGRRNTSRA